MKNEDFQKHFRKDTLPQSAFFEGYEVYFSPCSQGKYEMPADIRREYLYLLEKAQIAPKECFSNALSLKKQHESPELDNLLTYLHLQRKELSQAERLIEETYKKYPDYFFAKINYGDQLLRKAKLEEFSHLFPSQELKENCQGRTRFHVSEYRSFMLLMSHYFLAKKDKEVSLLYFHKAHQADPAHPSVLALEKKLFTKGLFQKLLLLAKRPFAFLR